jgi:hypothetical protein
MFGVTRHAPRAAVQRVHACLQTDTAQNKRADHKRQPGAQVPEWGKRDPQRNQEDESCRDNRKDKEYDFANGTRGHETPLDHHRVQDRSKFHVRAAGSPAARTHHDPRNSVADAPEGGVKLC